MLLAIVATIAGVVVITLGVTGLARPRTRVGVLGRRLRHLIPGAH